MYFSSSRPSGPRNWRAPRTPHQQNRQIAQPRNSQPRAWQSPAYRGPGGGTSSKLQLNESRRKVCPKSPFWYEGFDLVEHRKDWKAGELRREQAAADRKSGEEDEKQRLEKAIGEPFPTPRPLHNIFEDKVMLADAGLSTMLAKKTIFTPNFLPAKEDVAPWPNKHEMDYEGESRLATDRLHRRFLPLPRVSTDESVNWQHRVAIPQYAFEEYYVSLKTWDNPLGVNWEDVFFRMLRVQDFEFTDPDTEAIDPEGRHALGDSLVAAMEPQDQWA